MACRRSIGLAAVELKFEGFLMDGDASLDQLALTKYGIGQPVPRNEDPMLLRGQGRYTDDLSLPGQAYAVMVRSGYAHGLINAIDTEEARTMPGVLGIFTGPDLTAAGIKNMPLGQAVPTREGTEMYRPSCPVLTSDKVRYVGDPIAIVVAETVAQAKDAAEAVFVNIDALPAVTCSSEAAALGAPQLRCAGQRRSRIPLRRRREGRRGFRLSGARYASRNPEQPHRRLPDGAALGDRGIRCGGGPLDLAGRMPGRLRPA
jgi:hypothetical protein